MAEPERTRRGPLAGLRVLELAGIGPGPFCAMMLADQGAAVLRVDRPGDAGRGGSRERDFLSRGRRSAVLDLKHPRAVDAVLRLADNADVLIEGLRPGVTERLGVGPDVCLARNPRLVYARMTGWGQDGPMASTVGHDIGYIARTGALHGLGRAGGPPQFPGNLLGDFGGGGMLMAYGICAALVERATSGQGQVVDAAIVDGVASLLAMPLMFMAQGMWRDERGVNLLDGGVPWYDVYETADGKWMAVGALEPRFYAALLAGLGLDDAPDRGDPANWPELRALFTARFKDQTRDEWAAVFGGGEACAEPVLSLREAAHDPHLAARETYVERDGFVQPAPSPRFSRTPGQLPGPAPVPGQHTAEALAEWGLADAPDLIACGAAYQAPLAVRDQRPVRFEVRVVVEGHQAGAHPAADDLGDARVDHQPGQAGPALDRQPEGQRAVGGDDPARGRRDRDPGLDHQIADRALDPFDERVVGFAVPGPAGDPAADRLLERGLQFPPALAVGRGVGEADPGVVPGHDRDVVVLIEPFVGTELVERPPKRGHDRLGGVTLAAQRPGHHPVHRQAGAGQPGPDQLGLAPAELGELIVVRRSK
ncbi:MAG: CaiB/BaiF CoA-transferase family protein [Streptosporangiaceae bacterium]|jgi:alpha-methylacyl-CoA racemase